MILSPSRFLPISPVYRRIVGVIDRVDGRDGWKERAGDPVVVDPRMVNGG